jgi:hypothetical protein
MHQGLPDRTQEKESRQPWLRERGRKQKFRQIRLFCWTSVWAGTHDGLRDEGDGVDWDTTPPPPAVARLPAQAGVPDFVPPGPAPEGFPAPG